MLKRIATVGLLLAGCGVDLPEPRLAVLTDAAAPGSGDAERVFLLLQQTNDIVRELQAARGSFEGPEEQPLDPDTRVEVLRLWASLVDHQIALDGARQRFRRGWYSTEKDEALRAFAVGWAAYVGQLRAAMTILEVTSGKPAYERLLNEPQPEFGVAEGHLDLLRLYALGPHTAFVLRGLHDYERSLADEFRRYGLLADPQFAALLAEAHGTWKETDRLYWRHGIRLTADSSAELALGAMFDAIMPIQRGAAEWMGNTKVWRLGNYLISLEQLDALRSKLEPGDVFVARRNWYVSNVGLPGFWPHAELYVGTEEALAAYFDGDPEILAVWPEGFSAHLKATYPMQWGFYSARSGDGNPVEIIEAISEGVVFSSMAEGAKADYLGVMRPRLTKLEKARAIDRAFAHLGKPYDFDFDFLTDEKLVCSELVFKAYQAPGAEGRSLVIPLVKVAGRTTLPANELVRMFAEQAGTDRQQLDFVAFLDARERRGWAIWESEEAFKESHRRLKWDVAQR